MLLPLSMGIDDCLFNLKVNVFLFSINQHLKNQI